MTGEPPPTAGIFLRGAASELDLAGKPRPSRAEVRGAASAFGLVLTSLSRYLNGGILPGRWPQTAAAARAHLSRPAWLLKPPAQDLVVRLPGARPGLVADTLGSSARSLTAARDLLHTHFTPTPNGGTAHRSHWAPVIESPAVARALAAEVADYARRLEPLADGWARATADWPDFAHEAQAFAVTYHGLRATRDAMSDTLTREPATAGDRALLHAVPVNAPVPPATPQAAQATESVCRSIVITAERARQATWASRHPWSADNSEISLRRTAEAAAIASHNCEIALEMLADRARQLGKGTVAASLARAQEAAFTARSRWVDVAQRWNGQVVTITAATSEPTGPSAAVSELAVWTGRLVFADPAWTPGQGLRGVLRAPKELADSEDAIAKAVAALHHSADALHRIAESELVQTRAIGETGQMYVPAWSLPPDRRTAGLYCPAPPSRTHDLVRAYQEAEASGARLARTMDLTADAARAPSQVLTLARAATGCAADPAVGTWEPADRATRRSPGPVVRLLKDKGVARPELLAMAEELDDAVRAGTSERHLALRQVRSDPRADRKRQRGEPAKTAGHDAGSHPGGSPVEPVIQVEARRGDGPSQRFREVEGRQAPRARSREAAQRDDGDRAMPSPAQARQVQPEAQLGQGAPVASQPSEAAARPWREPSWPQPQSAPAAEGGRRLHEPSASHVPEVGQSRATDWRDQVIRSGMDGWQPRPSQSPHTRMPQPPQPGGPEIDGACG
jgi:hypothetical protein